MCFLAIPVVSALADDPQRFLERNAKLQWGIMVCVYGISHVPALLLLKFPNYDGKNAFLVFFLVFVVQSCMIVEHLVGRKLQRAAQRAQRQQELQLDQLADRRGGWPACWAACWRA
jgi:phosphatidate cytidylyltransferase